MFVTEFIGYNQDWQGGLMYFLWFCVQEHPKAQKTGPQLKVSSDRPGKAENRTCHPGLKGIGFLQPKTDVPSALSLR